MFIKFTTALFALIFTFSVFANEYFDKGFHAEQVKDYIQAIAWYQKAANQGHAEAQSNLGRIYYRGLGVEYDVIKANVWYQKAANQGHAEAEYGLALLYRYRRDTERDFAQAIAWYQKAANQGHAEAQYSLGRIYYNGRGVGVKQDYDQSHYWYLKAANQGHIEAQEIIGDNYFKGNFGAKKDYVQAATWYQKLADQGSDNAKLKLARMYRSGKGVKRDLNMSIALYTQSNKPMAKQEQLYTKKILNCEKANKSKLFNIILKCADRETLRTAVKKLGAEVIQESYGKWGDSYLSANILKNSSKLYLLYLRNAFAKAVYTFPSNTDTAQISKIYSFVSSKYGKADSAVGNTSVGKVTYEWYLEDGIVLAVSRGWPNTTTYITYSYPEKKQAVMVEQEQQRKAIEAENYEAQSNAF